MLAAQIGAMPFAIFDGNDNMPLIAPYPSVDRNCCTIVPRRIVIMPLAAL